MRWDRSARRDQITRAREVCWPTSAMVRALEFPKGKVLAHTEVDADS